MTTARIPEFRINPDIAGIVRPGVLWLEGATVVDREPRLDAVFANVEASVRADMVSAPGVAGSGLQPGGSGFRLHPSTDARGALSNVEGQPEDTAAVRAMYKRVGIDPTKTRPSSEALLRRVRKGDALPRINSMVDVCNWCSLEFQLPYGLYDADRIDGGVVELRLGREGESYAGIRKDDVHVAGRITLADARGVFGNPTSDSARTMTTTSTTRALVVVFAPHGYDGHRLGFVLDMTSQRMTDFTGAREAARHVG